MITFSIKPLLTSCLLALAVFHAPATLSAQAFCSDYGESIDETMLDMIPVSDGDMVHVGWRDNDDFGGRDLHVIKVQPSGMVTWAKTLRLSEVEGQGRIPTVGRALIQDKNGDLVIVGHTANNNNVPQDGLLVKMSLAGAFLQVQRISAGSLLSYSGVDEADNGDYFVTGRLVRSGQLDDYFIGRVSPTFLPVWSRVSGGTDRDVPNEVIALPNDRLAVIGQTRSFGAGGRDWMIVGVSGDGNTLSGSTVLGGPGDEIAQDIVRIPGTNLVVGSTSSFDPAGQGTFRKLIVAFGNAFTFTSDLVVGDPKGLPAFAEQITPAPGGGGFLISGRMGEDLDGLLLNPAGAPTAHVRVAHSGASLTGGFVSVLTNGETALGGTSTESGDSDFFVSKFSAGATCCQVDPGFTTENQPWAITTGSTLEVQQVVVLPVELGEKEGTEERPLCPSPKTRPVLSAEGPVNFEVFPNPARDQFTVRWTGEGEGRLSLRDAFGRVVRTQALVPGQQEISLRGLAAGVYLLEAQTGSENFNRRLVVE